MEKIKTEIIYISGTFRESDVFLLEIATELEKKGVFIYCHKKGRF